MRVVPLLLLLILASDGAGDPPSGLPPAAPQPATPEQQADAVLAGLSAGDSAALGALAAKDEPDPWLVADELIWRGAHDAAEAFARAAPRADVEALPGYVASRRGRSGDSEKRLRVGMAWTASEAGRYAEALDLLGAASAAGEADVSDIKGGRVRTLALLRLGRLEEARDAGTGVADDAERVGWLRGASVALSRAAEAARHHADYTGAVRLLLRLVALSERRGDRQGHASALRTLADVRRDTGEVRAALDLYGQALGLQQAAGLESDAAATWCSLGNLYFMTEEYAQALEAYERGLATMQARGDRGWAAVTLGNIGNVRYRQGDFEGALEAQQRALAEKEAVGDALGVARTLGNLGNVYLAMNDVPRALATYERAQRGMEALGDRAGAAMAMGHVAGVHLVLGDSSRARAVLEDALARSRELGAVDLVVGLSLDLGRVLGRLGEHGRAIHALERALEQAQAVGMPDSAGAIQSELGATLMKLRRPAEALAVLRSALAVHERRGSVGAADRTRMLVAMCVGQVGDFNAAIDMLQALLDQPRVLGAPATAALILGNLASMYARRGDHGRALELQQRALEMKVSVGDLPGSAHTRASLAEHQRALGDHEGARVNFEEALRVAEAHADEGLAAQTLGWLAAVHRTRGDQAAVLDFARRSVERSQRLYEGLTDLEATQARGGLQFALEAGSSAARELGRAADLAWFLEQSRARSLVGAIASRAVLEAASVPDALLQDRRLARAEVARAVGAWRRAKAGGVRPAREQMEQAQARLDAVETRLEREARASATETSGLVVELDAVQARLAPTEAFVWYGQDADGLVALVARREATRVVAIRGEGLNEQTWDLREALEHPGAQEDALRAAGRLQQSLVTPLGLESDVRRLIVSPTGALAHLPFGLLAPDREVVYAPSATVWDLLEAGEPAPGEGILALGDPEYADGQTASATAPRGGGASRKLERLPATRAEALAVGSVSLLGAEASESRLAAALATRPRWRAVHLACHGLVDRDQPMLSALALTPDAQDDGFLTAAEILRLQASCDLVVLSACETGRGRLYPGEGSVGLTRAFMLAGASRVLSSLWKVDDAATAALMTEFYARWKAGLSAAEALRAAQAHVRAQPNWTHPYYWAAWVLWGLP